MLKVFLVEDETVIREGLRDRIPWEQYGYRFVGEAADGEVALPLIRKTRPDVLITDIKMPFMDGLSLSRIVREEFPKTKILIISGYDDFEYAREAISIGVDQYILKPVTRMSLRKVLQELKEKIEAEQEQEDFQSKLANEMHEYEQFSIRHFFEQVLDCLLYTSGIRFDVYSEDDSGIVYDCEMQTSKKDNLPKRTRYYQGMIDLNLLERGADYKELKKSYVTVSYTHLDVYKRQAV